MDNSLKYRPKRLEFSQIWANGTVSIYLDDEAAGLIAPFGDGYRAEMNLGFPGDTHPATGTLDEVKAEIQARFESAVQKILDRYFEIVPFVPVLEVGPPED